MDKKYKIYFLKHPTTLEIRYIGETSRPVKSRLRDHINYDNKVSKKASWIKSLLKQSLIPLIEVVCSFNTLEECDLEEIKLIKQYREAGYRLTNDAPGGKSNAGCKRTPETCKKISLAKKGCAGWMKGKKMTNEHKKKLSKAKTGLKILNPKRGHKLSEKHKENISNSIRGEKNEFYGKKHSKETCEKLKKANSTPVNIKKSINNLKFVTKESIEKGRLNRIGWKQTEDAKRRIKETMKKTFKRRKKLKEKFKKTGQFYLF